MKKLRKRVFSIYAKLPVRPLSMFFRRQLGGGVIGYLLANILTASRGGRELKGMLEAQASSSLNISCHLLELYTILATAS